MTPEEAAQAYDEVMNESPFPEKAWDEIFSTVPEYPTGLPDSLVRCIADLAIHTRSLAKYLEAGLTTGDDLTTWMGPSLISGSMKQIERLVYSIQIVQETGLTLPPRGGVE